MAKKKGRSTSGGRGKTGSTTKTQVIEAWCPSCQKEAPILHRLTIGLKKRWSWNCASCGSEVSRAA